MQMLCSRVRAAAGLGMSLGVGLFTLTGAAHAADPYATIGAPGIVLGVAQPMNERVSLRADYATSGRHGLDGEQEGIDYRGRVQFSRVGLFADWFVAGGGFRLVGGATFNHGRMDLTAFGDGTPIRIGDTLYPTTEADRFVARVKFPDVTPYLGIGWGHYSEQVKGLSFLFDLGASIGQATVETRAEGPLLGQVSDEDLEKETRELRDGVDRVKAIPQATIGVAYRF
jgi:hypothetical protein